jgi:integrase
VVNLVFRQLVQAAGIGHNDHPVPVPHDLRHSSAVSVLLDWYRHGVDVGSRLSALSTYLGHTAPSSTYWYLQAAPELLALTVRRLEQP